MGEPLAIERLLGTRQRWVIQLRGTISVSKGFVCLQTEQLSLAGTQQLQIGHVKPGGENGEEGHAGRNVLLLMLNCVWKDWGTRSHLGTLQP